MEEKQTHTWFLPTSSRVSELILNFDWKKTNLGPIDEWPEELCTALNILLNSRFPIFLWWGDELRCFYNDAYGSTLGSHRHPNMLGERAEIAWKDRWEILRHKVSQIKNHGGVIWREDQLTPTLIDGVVKDQYWTYCYSPIEDRSGEIQGIIVICNETTKKVETINEMLTTQEELHFVLEAADIATWNMDPDTRTFIANEKLGSWFNLDVSKQIDVKAALSKVKKEEQEALLKIMNEITSGMEDTKFETQFTLPAAGEQEEKRLLAKGKVKFSHHKIQRFSGTLQDITHQYRSLRKIQESEKRFRNTVKQAPLGITILKGKDFVVDMANDTYLEIVGRSEEEFVGKSLFTGLPEVRSVVEPMLKEVVETGKPIYGREFPVTIYRHGKEESCYFNFVYQPFKEEEGDVSGVIVVANEITDMVEAKHQLAESERQFRNLIMQSPIPMTIFKGPDFIIDMANETMFRDIWRRKEKEVVGKKLLEVFPELMNQKYPELLRKVYETGEKHGENESIAYVQVEDEMVKFYLDYEYTPLHNLEGKVEGLIITVNNVTEKVEARLLAESAEERLRLATEAAELATWELDIKTRELISSPRMHVIFGQDKEVVLTHQLLRSQLLPEDRMQVVDEAWEKALQSGLYKYEARILRPDGAVRWIRTQGQLFYNDTKSKPAKLIGTIRDITDEKKQQQVLLESEKKFRLLADSLPQHVWTSDSEGYLNYFNASLFEYTGLSYAQLNDEQWVQVIHPDDRKKFMDNWKRSIDSGRIFAVEHRIRRADGMYRWHFTRATSQKDKEGHIKMWVGTSADIHDQKQFTDQLEALVNERTYELEQANIELKKTNAELQSFAYVSSHDLQEPLRKIRMFANRILEKEFENLSGTGKDYFERMQAAAARMQALIEDLLTYSRMNTQDKIFETTNITGIVSEVIQENKDHIHEKNAIIHVHNLGEADVIPFQVNQVFTNLITNSLKFSREGVTPEITIQAETVNTSQLPVAVAPGTDYLKITFSDNGIGFNNSYQEKIFEVFQRLHNRDTYAGTGIGLSIVKKIIDNHRGYIQASGIENQGATFVIYLPLKQSK